MAGLTKNVSRGRVPLYKELVLKRRHVDVTDCHPFFHEQQSGGKVYLITNNTINCGVDVAIDSFQEASRIQFLKRQDNRTNNDGLRLCCILLDPSLRGSVTGIMYKKKNRTKSDVAGDPTLHFYETILGDKFSNSEYVVDLPPSSYYDEFPEEEKGAWDPNSPSIFESERDATWLKATWDDYVRKKYKAALDRWNKDTGGGDGSPTSFINFCGTDRWLVWVFCLDLEANFLLAQSAGGRMPRHLQTEAGFDEVSSLGGDTDTTSSASNAKRNRMEDELSKAKKQRVKISEPLDVITDMLRKKEPEAVGEDEESKCLDQVQKYSAMLTDEKVLDSMSPESKEAYTNSLKRKRKDLLKKLG